MRNLIRLAAVAAVATAAWADPLNLSLQQAPDIFNSFITANYDASGQQFTADGYAFFFTYDNGTGATTYAINDGSFSLTANIANDGSLIGPNAGTLSISGDTSGVSGLPDYGSLGNPENLLTANLVDFGFVPGLSDGALEFAFQSTGGDLAPLYSSNVYMIMSQIGNGFTGDFSQSFSGDQFAGVADVGIQDPSPEPGSLILLTPAAVLLMFSRRRLFATSVR